MNQSSRPGKFISIEGIEGAGKSTAIKTIKKILIQHHIDHTVTREPGGTPLAESIRQLALTPSPELIHENTELLLMFASRAQHVSHLIEPAIAKGQWVVCDRFTDASYAYQGYGRGIKKELISNLEKIAHPKLQPDLTLLLDVSPEQGLKRIASRQQHDRIEKENIDFFRKIQQGYLIRAKAEPDRFIIIDSNQVLSKVKHAITEVMERYLLENKQ